MKSFTTLAIALATLTVSMSAQAAQENRGVSYCSSANEVCTNAAATLTVCIFESQRLGYVSIARGAGSTQHHYTVNEVPATPGIMGAPKEFKGESGFDLSIKTDTMPTSRGFTSTLSINSLERNVTLFCKMQ